MTRAKVCGITTREDARRPVDLGADALGFVFYPASPRYIHPEEAAKIIQGLPPFVASVGVFVDHSFEEINAVVATCGLTTVQFHGGETPDFCEPEDSREQVERYARDVVVEYIRKRFEL